MPTDPLPALGRVASGIYILTIGQAEKTTGMLASWVMQAGFDPPMVTVAVKKGRYVSDWLAAGEPFTLNIVGEKQSQFLKHFGKGFEPGEPAFAGVPTAEGDNGVPYLAEALGYLECQPKSHVDSADHRIYLAEVTGGKLLHETSPMTHIRKTGANY
jgi:flavin reductase (DIM6/NTAB) family NADH-FMN oxidoreductase RutF